jgi:diguanylate cyclase (GGDEF)-like protein
VITASLIIKKDKLFQKPDIYYWDMYIAFILAMAAYSVIFAKLEKGFPKRQRGIMPVGISFTVFSLSWCAGISLLDQLSSGQVIVYTTAIIAIAVTPFFKPATFFTIYTAVHTAFIILIPHFQKPGARTFGSIINSTAFVAISMAIAYMRFKKQGDDFISEKIIQEKNEELRRINMELEKLSQTDALTGICNRFVFDRTLESEWNRCKRQFSPLSLIMVDIDFFKKFNDNSGHQEGDECIRRVANALSACARRSSDTVTRYGGDEFAVILPDTDEQSAWELAEQVRKMVENLDFSSKHSISKKMSISIGLCTVVPSCKSSIDEFIRSADKALYEAKKIRNHIVVA